MQIVPLSALKDNYIWTLVAGRQCAVVDPGDAAPVRQYLADEGLVLTAILITHRHNDHIGGVAALREEWPVPVFGPSSIACVTQAVSEGDTFEVPDIGMRLGVMEVPGHTEEHIAYLGDGNLFCGDTLFSAGCGRLLGSSTAAELHASLQRLAALPGETRVFCTHEYTLSNLRFATMVDPDNAALSQRHERCIAMREANEPTLPSTIAIERETNPFLRTSRPEVISAVARHARLQAREPGEVFAALRAWKDVS